MKIILFKLLRKLCLITKLNLSKILLSYFVLGYIFVGLYLSFLAGSKGSVLSTLFFGQLFLLVNIPFIFLFLMYAHKFFYDPYPIIFIKNNSAYNRYYFLNKEFEFKYCKKRIFLAEDIFDYYLAVLSLKIKGIKFVLKEEAYKKSLLNSKFYSNNNRLFTFYEKICEQPKKSWQKLIEL